MNIIETSFKETIFENIEQTFRKHFGDTKGMIISIAPGRVNLIGEHTDYNDGFVLPMTIDRAVYVGIRARSDTQCKLFSMNFDEEVTWQLNDITKSSTRHWSDYVKGVMTFILESGRKLSGVEGVLFGDIPIGSGLSSSAAVEIATAYGLQQMFGFDMEPVEMIRLCQKAENEFVGVKCGIMDQFVSRLGKKDRALFLDCQTLEYKLIPMVLKDSALLIVDTKVKRELANSAYNQRRTECHQAVEYFRLVEPNVKALRDVTTEMFQTHKKSLLAVVQKRTAHVISEDQRVLDAVKVLNDGQKEEFGKLLYASHQSLKENYEVSCDELDFIVDFGKTHGALGARLTGAGFGGSTLVLVPKGIVKKFIPALVESYRKRFSFEPGVMHLQSNLETGILQRH